MIFFITPGRDQRFRRTRRDKRQRDPLTAIVRGTSNLDAAALAVKDAQIGAEGPSQVRLAATATAKIDARGTTSVAVSGNPSCTVKAEGSAVVTGCE